MDRELQAGRPAPRPQVPWPGAGAGRLTATPGEPRAREPLAAGNREIPIPIPRKPILRIPPGLDVGEPAPLLILLHGAGATASDVMPAFAEETDASKILVLAPQSEGPSWDLIIRTYGPDLIAIDQALAWIFDRLAIDPARIAISGFSDGASYALTLGLVNGLLFSDVLAFSPGFMAPEVLTDKPRIFISHGTDDPVLPIERCSRRLASRLAEGGYDVDYREFLGGHVIPRDMVRAALTRLLGHEG